MTNIERFNDCTARLFAFLYEKFPFKGNLDFFEWLGKDVLEPGDDEAEFCYATLEWLRDAGYISIGVMHTNGASNIALTAKGLEVLKAVPESLNAKTSIGTALIERVRGGAFSAAGKLVEVAFTEGFKMMVRNA